MNTRRLKALARAGVLLLGLTSLAYSATTRLPGWLTKLQHMPPCTHAMTTYFHARAMISVGRYELNVAFTPHGEPVYISVSTKTEG
jgi:hypothetical protein